MLLFDWQSTAQCVGLALIIYMCEREKALRVARQELVPARFAPLQVHGFRA